DQGAARERLHHGGQGERPRTVARRQPARGREAATGFEPVHGGFADLSLSHLGTPPSDRIVACGAGACQRNGRAGGGQPGTPPAGGAGVPGVPAEPSVACLRFSSFFWRFSSAFMRRSASRRSRTLLLKARPPAMRSPPGRDLAPRAVDRQSSDPSL